MFNKNNLKEVPKGNQLFCLKDCSSLWLDIGDVGNRFSILFFVFSAS